MLDIKKPRGTNDFFYDSSKRLEYIENKIKNIVKLYGYGRIRTPLFEYTDLFTRGIGEGTDIVGKEMFTFEDRGGRSLTLRPEGTASVARAYVENSMQNEFAINKLFYLGTMYRAERPQKGRYREFNQFGVECIGNSSPLIDAEIILLNINVLKEFGIDDVNLLINTVGCSKCKPSYNNALKEAIGSRKEELCETCQKRYEGNILRILDCKNEKCKETIKDIPKFYDYVCDECKEHFDKLCEELTRIGQNFTVDPMLVRGLDYYTHTVFEVEADIKGFGSQNVLAAGGRYDHLVEFIGGPSVPGVGFALGLERLLLALEKEGIDIKEKEPLDVYIFGASKEEKKYILSLGNTLRMNGFNVEIDYNNKSFKSNFKKADSLLAKYIIIIGEEEVKSKILTVKNNKTKEEYKVKLDNLIEFLDEKLGDDDED